MNFPWLVLGVVGTAAIAGVFGRISRQWHVAAIGASTGILLLQHFYFHYTADDAYISYRYARNLADGIGPVWNPGERIEGYTNFLWVAILAGLHKLGADIVVSSRWLGFSLAALSGAGAYLVTRDLLPGTPGRIAGFLACVLLAASGAWSMWATAGLEAPLFAALTLAGVLLHTRERPQAFDRPGWPPCSGAVWAFVVMTRPDGMVFVAVSAVFKLYDAFVRTRSAPRGQRIRIALQSASQVGLWAALFAALFLPYFLWRYNYYGWFFPNTYYAKIGGGWDQADRGVKYILDFLQESGGWLLLLLPLAIAESAVRRTAAAYVLTLAGAWFAYTAYVGGDSLLRYRFIAPILPLYYSVMAVTAVAVATRLRSALPRRRYTAEAIAVVGVLAAIAITLHPQSVDAIDTRNERLAVENRIVVGRWLRDNLPPETKVAAIPIGALGYESQVYVLDMLGITDEHIAHRDLDIGSLAAGHEKYDSEYVLDQEPDIILLFDFLTDDPVEEEGYRRLRNSLIPAAADMASNERLFEEYERRVAPVEDQWINLLVRNDAREALRATDPAP